MQFRESLHVWVAVLTFSIALVAQGQVAPQGTIDERLQAMEDRIAAVEDRLARSEEGWLRTRRPQPDRLSAESLSRLDRLEVRVIRLENSPGGCDCGGGAQSSLAERVRSLERQVSRIRARSIR